MSEPSATTPDVEQIAREAAKKLPAGPEADAYPKAVRIIVEAIAQACEPLVDALEAWQNFPHMIEPHCDDCARAAIHAMELSFVALGGKGEKMSEKGKTTKQKKE